MELTAEFGTPTARGIFQVADRRFTDRRLTRQEKQVLRAGALYSVEEGQDQNAAFCCAMLNALRVKPSDPEITLAWLDQQLTDEELALVVTYILQGPEGVRKALLSGETPPT